MPGKDAENKKRHGERAGILRKLYDGADVGHDDRIKAVDVHHPDLRRLLFNTFREHGVQYLVALYEADAELASLARAGRIDGVFTRDSDLIVLDCPLVINEMSVVFDASKGNCEYVTLPTKLSSLSDPVRLEAHLGGLDDDGRQFVRELVQYSTSERRAALALFASVGCDYSDISGVGWKTAAKALVNTTSLTPDNYVRALVAVCKKQLSHDCL